jgi:hypothetical protein
MRQLHHVYSAKDQHMVRRCRAAFSHAVASISLYIKQDPDDESDSAMISEALDMLYFASSNGHEGSQLTIGWLQATFRPNDAPLVSRAQEIVWLARGMTKGSRMCRQRLALLDPERHQETMKLLRREYCGIGSNDWHMASLWPAGVHGSVSADLWYYSVTGDERKARSLLSDHPWTVNSHFLDETPLIGACRSGHSNIVRILLNEGADAARLDHLGRGALHFLSSFDTQDVAEMAHLLLGSGGELETWSTGSSDLSCSQGRPGFDSKYGHGNGTALLWAVQANYPEAVQVLLDLGAKVFPTARPANPRGRHFSPVHWASRMHQSNILGMLLDYAVRAGVDVAAMLNTAPEAMEEGVLDMVPLEHAVSYPGGFAASRIMLHGADHIQQCFKTVHLLLGAGARVDGGEYSIFSAASGFGPCHGLQALFAWRGARLCPDFSEWAKCLVLASGFEDRGTFNLLLAADVETMEGRGWPEIIDALATRTDDTYYIKAAIAKHKALSPPRADYSAAFSNAWIMGHHKVAQCIFDQTDRYDVVTHRPIDGTGTQGSVLGFLIRESKFRPSGVKSISAFLDCLGARDSIFENVIQIVEGDESTHMDALQLALFYWPRSNISIGVDILDALTKHFRHPKNHLGKVYGSDRDTLLHLAIRSGHSSAADFLLKLPGMEAIHGQRQARDLTAFDVCLIRWADSVRDSSFSFMHDIDAGVPKSKVIEYWNAETEEFTKVLTRHGANKHGKLSHMIKRVSANEVLMVEVGKDGKVSHNNFPYQGK